jgi:small-conductance mechanosensitive channel
MDAINEFLAREFLGNTVQSWAVAVGSAALIPVVLWPIRAALAARLRRVAQRTATRLDDLALDLLNDLRGWTVAVVALWVGSLTLVLDPRVAGLLQMLGIGALGLQLIVSSRLVVDFALHGLLERSRDASGQPDPSVASSLGVVRFLAMLAIAVVVVLLGLDNMGVRVTPLLAGLGIGGIAVALAVQNILSDLFASLTIVLDKPFAVGDAIQVGDKSGSVERIGVKTTRVRAPTGEQIVFANSDLLSGRLHNFKRMEERRVTFGFGLVYSTPAEKLAGVPGVVAGVVNAVPGARLDRCHLRTLGAYSLDFEVSYLVESGDFRRHMDTLHAVNIGLLRAMAAEGIEFAYPTSVQYDGAVRGTPRERAELAVTGPAHGRP